MNVIGHENTKKQIYIALKAAKKDNRALPHMLIAGAAGCGKTSMAKKVAIDTNSEFINVSPDDFKSQKTIKAILKGINHDNYSEKGDRVGAVKPSIIFIDEIHRLNIIGQEIFGIAMEEFELESDRPGKKYWLPYFTVIGATTNDGILSKPFRDRFKLKFLFKPYSDEEIEQIIDLNAKKMGTNITPAARREIAKRSRGIPRKAISHFESVRDYVLSIDAVIITSSAAKTTFETKGVDENGLENKDREVLKVLYDNKLPIGVENLAVITNEAAKTISDSVEPFLIQRGLMIRSSKGRLITETGIRYLEAHGDENKIQKVDIDSNYVRK